MENASQALLIAGGMLIALLVISVGVYLFSSASGVSENYDRTVSETEMQKINSRFIGYDKTHDYKEYELKDGTTYKFFYNYNTASDVVSAINSAYNITAKNNYDIQSGIQVNIKLNGTPKFPVNESGTEVKVYEFGITPLIQKKFWESTSITPRPYDKNKMYPIDDIKNKSANTGSADKNECVSLNWLLENFSNSKIITTNEGDSRRVYEYGFDGEIVYNKESGLIDIITFTLVKNNNF